MIEWIKKNWLIIVAVIGAVLIFASGTGVGIFTVKRQLAEVAQYQQQLGGKLSEIGNGIDNLESISVELTDRVGSLESSTGRIETAVDGLESTNVNIEYTIGVGEGLVTESERIIRESLAIVERIEAEVDTNNDSDGGG
jgi:hypothetical protein